MTTFVIGSPEHKKYQRDEVDKILGEATLSLADDSVFTEDQIKVLQNAFWAIRHAIHKTI